MTNEVVYISVYGYVYVSLLCRSFMQTKQCVLFKMEDCSKYYFSMARQGLSTSKGKDLQPDG